MRLLTGFELYHWWGHVQARFVPPPPDTNPTGSDFPKRQLDHSAVLWIHVQHQDQLFEFSDIIKQLREKHPDLSVIATYEHRQQVNQHWPRDLNRVLPAPSEDMNVIKAFLAHCAPDALIWNSNKMRPYLIGQVARHGIPSIFTNADLGDEQRKTLRWIRPFYGAYLTKFTRILAKSDRAATNLRRLNAPRHKLEVVGELTAGAAALPYVEEEYNHLAAQIGVRPLWFASHVELAELANLAKTQRRASRLAQRLLLLVHLHDDRATTAAQIRLNAMGLRVAQLGQAKMDDIDVCIIDSAISLGTFYRLAPVSYIGRSFSGAGGHDPYEAAALGSAILSGPNINNYRASYERLTDAGGAIVVHDSAQMGRALGRMMSPDVAAKMAHAAWLVSTSGAEVSDRLLELLDDFLPASA